MKAKTFSLLTLSTLILFSISSLDTYTQDTPWWKEWERYDDNPIIKEEAWFHQTFQPKVIHEDGIFKMWFTGWNWGQGVMRIGYAESADGIIWNFDEEPLTALPAPDDWNFNRHVTTILRINDTLKMWYFAGESGAASDTSVPPGSYMGYAWSSEDGIWNWHPEPILAKGEEGTWDEECVWDGHVFYDGTVYHMYYSNQSEIGYATSSNGIDWVKDYDNSPVILKGFDGTWFDEWIRPGPLVKTGDTLFMFALGHDGTYSWGGHCLGTARTGLFWSVDFKNWYITNNAEPVFSVGLPGTWDDGWAEVSSIIVHDNKLKMWYTGYDRVFFTGYAEGMDVPYECMEEGVTFNNQWQIDNFGNEYPFCTEIQGTLEIAGNDITNLEGLRNISVINGDLKIHDNERLEALEDLNKLHTIHGDLAVYSNNLLWDFKGFEELTYIYDDLSIISNSSLTSLEGLENIDSGSLNDLIIVLNENLDHCPVEGICYYLVNPNGKVTIENNGPFCSDSTTIRQSCSPPVSVEDVEYLRECTVYPNPFGDNIDISLELPKPGEVNIILVNQVGMVVQSTTEYHDKGVRLIRMDTESLSSGIYLCLIKLTHGNAKYEVLARKVVKL